MVMLCVFDSLIRTGSKAIAVYKLDYWWLCMYLIHTNHLFMNWTTRFVLYVFESLKNWFISSLFVCESDYIGMCMCMCMCLIDLLKITSS